MTSYTRTTLKQTGLKAKAKKPRYGRNQSVDEGVAQRTDKRLERLQRPVKGVDASDGYTGAEARKVKAALAKKKDSKPTLRAAITPYQRRRRRAHALQRSWTQPERYIDVR